MAIDIEAADDLLTTTRSVRKRLDLNRPVPLELVQECIDIALQAPTPTNSQNWAFLVVTDAEQKAVIADCYRRGMADLEAIGYTTPPADPDKAAAHARVMESAGYLMSVLERVPVFVIPCIQARVEHLAEVVPQAVAYGGIMPAAWSFMLAARARGLGTVWTSLHLHYERDAAAALGIPDDWTQAAMIPVAYFTGDGFRRAKRTPAREVTHWDRWGNLR